MYYHTHHCQTPNSPLEYATLFPAHPPFWSVASLLWLNSKGLFGFELIPLLFMLYIPHRSKPIWYLFSDGFCLILYSLHITYVKFSSRVLHISQRCLSSKRSFFFFFTKILRSSFYRQTCVSRTSQTWVISL